MTSFFAMALYLAFSTFLLLIVPVCLVPGLPLRRKILICLIGFVLIVPGGLLLYARLGAPGMALL
jgi:hypothetical protein